VLSHMANLGSARHICSVSLLPNAQQPANYFPQSSTRTSRNWAAILTSAAVRRKAAERVPGKSSCVAGTAPRLSLRRLRTRRQMPRKVLHSKPRAESLILLSACVIHVTQHEHHCAVKQL
jgi:hypothetical protein